MEIRPDDLEDPRIQQLLAEHLNSMNKLSPPESVHALDVDELGKAEVTFWAAWEGDELLGCGAIKEIDDVHAEVKSMRTAVAHLRRGVARRILDHMLVVAKRRGYNRLSLETGSMDAFEPARRLYASFGFEFCGPFADYIDDPNSVFMTKKI